MILITDREDHELFEEVVPAKSSWSGAVKKGQQLKITDLEGQ